MRRQTQEINPWSWWKKLAGCISSQFNKEHWTAVFYFHEFCSEIRQGISFICNNKTTSELAFFGQPIYVVTELPASFLWPAPVCRNRSNYIPASLPAPRFEHITSDLLPLTEFYMSRPFEQPGSPLPVRHRAQWSEAPIQGYEKWSYTNIIQQKITA